MTVRCKPPLYFAALPLHASAAFSWSPVHLCPTLPRTPWRRRSPRCFGGVQLRTLTSARKTEDGTLSALVYRGIVVGTFQKRKRVRCLDLPIPARLVLELSPIHQAASTRRVRRARGRDKQWAD